MGVSEDAYVATKTRKAGKSPEDESDVDALRRKAKAARKAVDEAEARRAETDDADSSDEMDCADDTTAPIRWTTTTVPTRAARTTVRTASTRTRATSWVPGTRVFAAR